MHGDIPVLLALNKADVLKPQDKDAYIAAHTTLIAHEKAFLISALTGDGVPDLMDYLFQQLPTGPRYYPVDQVSEVNMRFVTAEIIREVMLHTEQEIPHAVAVEVDSYLEYDDETEISAIYVERDFAKRDFSSAKAAA